EGGVPFLPMKCRKMGLANPCGRGFLQFPHEIGEAMGGFQGYQKMDVIRDSTDSLRQRIESLHHSAEIGMEFGSPGCADGRLPVLRREDQVIMKTGVGRGHGGRWLAPLPGYGFSRIPGSLVSRRSTTGHR